MFFTLLSQLFGLGRSSPPPPSEFSATDAAIKKLGTTIANLQLELETLQRGISGIGNNGSSDAQDNNVSKIGNMSHGACSHGSNHRPVVGDVLPNGNTYINGIVELRPNGSIFDPGYNRFPNFGRGGDLDPGFNRFPNLGGGGELDPGYNRFPNFERRDNRTNEKPTIEAGLNGEIINPAFGSFRPSLKIPFFSGIFNSHRNRRIGNDVVGYTPSGRYYDHAFDVKFPWISGFLINRPNSQG